MGYLLDIPKDLKAFGRGIFEKLMRTNGLTNWKINQNWPGTMEGYGIEKGREVPQSSGELEQ